MNYRIGVDVGGTNTDAIIIDQNNKIIAKTKSPTTKDIISGIKKSIEFIISDSKVDLNKIDKAMLGTTQCTNAIVERKNLKSVVTIRLASYCTQSIMPFCDWPSDLENYINEASYVVNGGYEYDGTKMLDVDYNQIKEIVENHNDCNNYAISCVFAPINGEQERLVRDIIIKFNPNAIVSISSEIGTLSLLERENATILNSALSDVIENVTSGFKNALNEVGINTKSIYLCQNDGTLMDVEYAKIFPILTIASGPTNSIRGGIYLTNQINGIVLDVGGTTSDIGVVANGFPRETTTSSEIGGVSTNFRMPDIISIAIGGGTIVEIVNNEIKVGPKSVGYNITSEAIVFGGTTITLTDIAVKLNMCEVGNKDLLNNISIEFANEVMQIVKSRVEDAIDLVRINNEKSELILVGGGGVIIPRQLDNVKNIYIPDNFDVANAIGSSIAKISGSFEEMVSFNKIPRETAIEKAIDVAKQNAINAGALNSSLEVVEIEEFPIAYHPENAVKLRVKVVGELSN